MRAHRRASRRPSLLILTEPSAERFDRLTPLVAVKHDLAVREEQFAAHGQERVRPGGSALRWTLFSIVTLVGVWGPALAHQRQILRVGPADCLLVVGSLDEPLFTGDKSGVSADVTRKGVTGSFGCPGRGARSSSLRRVEGVPYPRRFGRSSAVRSAACLWGAGGRAAWFGRAAGAACPTHQNRPVAGQLDLPVQND